MTKPPGWGETCQRRASDRAWLNPLLFIVHLGFVGVQQLFFFPSYDCMHWASMCSFHAGTPLLCEPLEMGSLSGTWSFCSFMVKGGHLLGMGAIQGMPSNFFNECKAFFKWMRWRLWHCCPTSPPRSIREHPAFTKKNSRCSLNGTRAKQAGPCVNYVVAQPLSTRSRRQWESP